MRKLITKLCAATFGMAIAMPPQAVAQTQSLPYEITFAADNYATWTLVDANNDGDNFGAKKWAWNSSNRYLSFNLVSSQIGNADDWAISPAFALEAGTQYEIIYMFYGDSGSSSKNIPVDLKLVTSNTSPEASGTVIASYPPAEGGSTNKNDAATTVTFTATQTGTFYIGAHLTASYVPYTSGGPAQMSGRIVFRNFGIKALQRASAPGAVPSLQVTPGANGASTATISFTAPAVDAENKPLTGKVKVNLYREDAATPFYTSPEMDPGATGSATDVAAFTGETWYVAKAENGSGEGPETRADTWIGEDLPVAVTNLQAKVGQDGKMSVTWTAPAAAMHGGYINYGNLTYQLSRVVNDQLTSLGSVNATSYTDNNLSADNQTNVSYQVVARSGGGLGASAQSATVNFGRQLNLPFAESFANKNFQTSPWRQEVVFNFEDANYQPTWDIIEQAVVTDNVTDDNPEGDEIIIPSQDTDRGFLRFNSNAVGKMKEPAKGRLVSPAIDFSSMVNPVLTFWMFRETYYTTNPATNGGNRDDYVVIEVASENGGFTPVEGAEFHRYGRDNKWVLCEVPLYAMAGKSRVQVAFNGAGFGGGPIYIDNVKIEEKTAYDLQAAALAGPARVRVGETAGFSFSVKNGGGVAVSDYKMELCKDGVTVVSVDGKTIKPGQTVTTVLEYTPATGEEGADAEFTGKVVYAADQDQANNVSEVVKSRITAPLLPAVTGLEGKNNDGVVTLTWGAADYLPAETLIEQDGFEGYEPFVINSFGDFSCFDLDGRTTFGIGAAAGVTYPNSGEKMAFQIFAPALTNIDDEEQHLWAAHSGANMAIAPQAMSAGNPSASNDWLVFPRLSGNAQTVKFFARSFSEDYSEFVQGFYATTANPTEADDFLPCPDGGDVSYSVPVEWSELSYSVPKGAKYFALRHVSADGYALMVDDVTYERSIPDAAEAGLLGYNVYCNGVKVNDAPVAARTLDHTPSVGGELEYAVSAVYPAGESSKCAPVKVLVTEVGIDGVVSGAFAISADGLRVVISGSADGEARLLTPSGVMVASASCDGGCVLDAPSAGVYVLVVGNRAVKMVLR